MKTVRTVITDAVIEITIADQDTSTAHESCPLIFVRLPREDATAARALKGFQIKALEIAQAALDAEIARIQSL